MFAMTTFFYSRAALQLWKQRLGSKATYKELKNVFERAGYCNYADTIRKVVTDSKSILPTYTRTELMLQIPFKFGMLEE